MCDIILTVKKFLLTTTLILAACAATAGGYALADGQTEYPQNFDTDMQFTALADYTVCGDKFAFADGNFIKTYEGGKVGGPDREFSYAITNVEYVGGLLVFQDSSGAVYCYGDDGVAEYSGDYVFNVPADPRADSGGYIYYFNSSELTAVHTTDDEVFKFEGTYSGLKQYGDDVYAIKENKLYSLKGFESDALEFLYDDYTPASSVFLGDTAERLKAGGDIKFVTVAGGAYITEVDLNDLGGQYFKVTETVKSSDGMRAFLLCTSGNASLISVGNKSYITLTANTTEVTYTPVTADKTEGYVTLPTSAYSSPFMSGGTALFAVEAGTKVKITGLVSDDVLSADYYSVELNGKTGYMAKSFITEYSFDAEDNVHDEIKENYSEDNAIQTVTIVLLIVAIALIIIGYLIFVATQRDKQKKNVKKD